LFIRRIIAAAAPGWQSRFNPPFRARQGLLFSAPNLGAGPLALPPAPAAAQRLPRFLWQPAAWDYEGLAPPPSGRDEPPSGELRPVRTLEGLL